MYELQWEELKLMRSECHRHKVHTVDVSCFTVGQTAPGTKYFLQHQLLQAQTNRLLPSNYFSLISRCIRD